MADLLIFTVLIVMSSAVGNPTPAKVGYLNSAMDANHDPTNVKNPNKLNAITCNPVPRFVSREKWNANPPTGSVTSLDTPVPYVVIHHTYTPGICMTTAECMQAMRSMQDHHQNGNEWFDIGYNFAVGGEGSVYEGRGWKAVGAHAAGTNSRSIGIAIIGDFISSLPPSIALQSTKHLIREGVRRGYIRADYKLVGHKQVSDTACPGDALFQEIQSWPGYSANTESED